MQIPAPDSILLVEVSFAPSVKQVMVAPSPALKCDGICCMADNCTADCAGEFPAPKRIRIITGDCCNSNTIQ